jgi:hypothetical protein
MIPSRLSRRLLRLLLSSRQNDVIIDFMDMCEACCARPYAVLKALQALGSAGLVEPSRLRLTFEGLAVASALAFPVQPDAVQPDAVQPDAVQPDAVQPDAALQPVAVQPAFPEPAFPEPAFPEPAFPEPASAGPVCVGPASLDDPSVAAPFVAGPSEAALLALSETALSELTRQSEAPRCRGFARCAA